MPNTAEIMLPVPLRSVAGYLQSRGGTRAVAKTRRVRELEDRVADLEAKLEAQAHMPVAMPAAAYPLVRTPRAVWSVHRPKAHTSMVARPAPMRKPRALLRKLGALVWKVTKGSAQVVNHSARAANELLTSFGD